MTIGIIGLGSFGQFAARVLANQPDTTIIGFDAAGKDAPEYIQLADLATVARADYVVLAVPLEAYGAVLPQLRDMLAPESLLIDICSVKTLPEQAIRRELPDHQNLLFSHPLFGPQSAPDGNVSGKQFIVTGQVGERAAEAVQWCRDQLGVQVTTLTAEEHDRHMAQVHALTFFVARGLNQAGVAPGPFDTPSFGMLLDLVRFDQTHSEELFRTIQKGNPYASEYCDKLVAAFDALSADIKNQPPLV